MDKRLIWQQIPKRQMIGSLFEVLLAAKSGVGPWRSRMKEENYFIKYAVVFLERCSTTLVALVFAEDDKQTPKQSVNYRGQIPLPSWDCPLSSRHSPSRVNP